MTTDNAHMKGCLLLDICNTIFTLTTGPLYVYTHLHKNCFALYGPSTNKEQSEEICTQKCQCIGF